MPNICIHAIVSGRVQGVFFRDGTRKKALSLNLTGWVKNTSDGNVELIACGDENKIQEFKIWLKKGPPLAKVKGLNIQEIPTQELNDFKIIQ